MKCSNCNTELANGVEFCSNCGTKMNVTNNKNDNNKKKTIIVIILILILLAAIGVCVYIMLNGDSGKGNSGSDPKPNNVEPLVKKEVRKNVLTGEDEYIAEIDVDNLKIEYADDLAKNIKVEKVIYTTKEKLIIYAKNNNSIPVEVDTEIQYLDANGVRVAKAIGWDRQVDVGKEFSDEISNASKSDFESYKLVISASKIKSYEYTVDANTLEIVKEETDSYIKAKYTNSNPDKARIYISFVYYKNNEVVYVDSSAIYASQGETDEAISYFNLIPDDIKYDRYEIIVSSATFSKDYY